MNIEHLGAGCYMVHLVDAEYHALRLIAMRYVSGNISATIRKILTEGISVYNDFIKQQDDDDSDLKRAMKILAKDLFEIPSGD